MSEGWISVKDRLPEDGTWNLFTDGKKMSVERYKSDALDHFYPDGRWFSLDELVAWMPLPEPYKPTKKLAYTDQSGLEYADNPTV